MECHARSSAAIVVTAKGIRAAQQLESKPQMFFRLRRTHHIVASALLLATMLPLGSATTEIKTASGSIQFKFSSLLGNVRTTAYSGGTATIPVTLRSSAYSDDPGQPYEWWLKFDLTSLQGKQVDSATLSVTKCKAFAACAACKTAVPSTCSCPLGFTGLAYPSCGGGSMDETYQANGDDLTAWHIPANWDNTWTGADWEQTFNPSTQAAPGTGGSKKLSYFTQLSTVAQVGQSGTASLDVKNAWTSSSMIIEPTSPIVSFRLTVTGTSSRFFVPVGTSATYEPKLTLLVSAAPVPAGPTTSVNTSTSTNATTTTSTATTTTSTTITSTNSTTTTTLFSGKVGGPVTNYTYDGPTGPEPAGRIPLLPSVQSGLAIGDVFSLTDLDVGITESGFTVVSLGDGRRLQSSATGSVIFTPRPNHAFGANSLFAVSAASGSSVGRDPVAFFGKQSRDFWLPVGELTLILQTRHLSMYASTFAGGSPHEQWMDRLVVRNADGFHFADIRIKNDILSFDRNKSHPRAFETLDVRLGMKKHPMSMIPEDLPGQRKVFFSRMDVALVTAKLSGIFKDLPFHLDQKTIGRAQREAVILYSPDVRILIISSPATEYSGDFGYLAVKYAHLDIHILEMQNRASIRGLLPELWGLKKMSNATQELTCPPWAKDAPNTQTDGVAVDSLQV